MKREKLSERTYRKLLGNLVLYQILLRWRCTVVLSIILVMTMQVINMRYCIFHLDFNRWWYFLCHPPTFLFFSLSLVSFLYSFFLFSIFLLPSLSSPPFLYFSFSQFIFFSTSLFLHLSFSQFIFFQFIFFLISLFRNLFTLLFSSFYFFKDMDMCLLFPKGFEITAESRPETAIA